MMTDIMLTDEQVGAYLGDLINKFYKIIPIKEGGEGTLAQYMKGLAREMIGFSAMESSLRNDHRYSTLLSILHYHINDTDADFATLKSDVFKAISLLKKIRKEYISDK